MKTWEEKYWELYYERENESHISMLSDKLQLAEKKIEVLTDELNAIIFINGDLKHEVNKLSDKVIFLEADLHALGHDTDAINEAKEVELASQDEDDEDDLPF